MTYLFNDDPRGRRREFLSRGSAIERGSGSEGVRPSGTSNAPETRPVVRAGPSKKFICFDGKSFCDITIHVCYHVSVGLSVLLF